MIRIVMDTGGDLPPELIEQYGITTVPINIHFGTQVFQEGVDITASEFYRRVEEEKVMPKTAQPSPYQFMEIYRKVAKKLGGTDIISVNITSQLSGTHASSLIAAAELADEVQVHAFDTRAGSGGQGLMALEAARLAKANMSVDKILARLKTMREQMNIVLVLDNLKFAQMSGRVSSMAATLSSVLKIKPLVDLQDGMLEVTEKVRTKTRAMDRMVAMVKERVGERVTSFVVVHAEAPEAAAKLAERVKREFRVKELFIESLSIGIAVHLGPGTVGLVASPGE